MSFFRKKVDPTLILGSGLVTFLCGLALLFTIYKPISFYFFMGSFAVVIWGVLEKRKQLDV